MEALSLKDTIAVDNEAILKMFCLSPKLRRFEIQDRCFDKSAVTGNFLAHLASNAALVPRLESLYLLVDSRSGEAVVRELSRLSPNLVIVEYSSGIINRWLGGKMVRTRVEYAELTWPC